MLPDAAVAHFVHFIELTLEKNEFTTFLRLFVYHALLKFFKRINNFEKVTVIKEKVKVFSPSLSDDCINGD